MPLTYTTLLRNREMRALFTGFAALVAGSSLGGLALATLVDAETGSPLLTALSLFGPTLANVLGASTLMSLADSARPRRVLVGLQLVGTLLVAGQLVPGLPLVLRFVLLIALGLVMSVAGGIRLGLLSEVVGESRYATARSLMNVATGSMQILGFAAAAVLLPWLSPRELFLADVLLLLASTVVTAVGVREHSARPVRRPSLRQTVTTNAWLARQRRLRPLLVTSWVPNGLVVGCEALFVPYAGGAAGSLFVAGALGMLVGDLAMGRLVTRATRARLSPWLRLLLAAPFLAFVAEPALPVAAALVLLATVGYSGTLALQERLLELTPVEVRGQVQGVEGAGRMTTQGLCALLAGGLAEVMPVGAAMTTCAALSIVVTLSTLHGVTRALGLPVRP
ncbi:hypothetical protein [Arsenicicoccus sp. UBA7492]|uniref:hypothetical protein n=1 Tax=Arsenicicoccus sp. UBA7492 TaxID=1946057 RepID=UPI00257BF814|nr:hypothetical protein [Arsenicicoccus sp. UBA7492]